MAGDEQDENIALAKFALNLRVPFGAAGHEAIGPDGEPAALLGGLKKTGHE